jgi:transposase
MPEEQEALLAGLRSSDAFTLRRSQILLASARGQAAQQIAPVVGCCVQTVRNTIRAFHANGVGSLNQQSCRPKSGKSGAPVLDAAARERIKQILHQSPRTFGKTTSLWTQSLLAEVCYSEGLTPELVSAETVRRALKTLGANWKRAKHWITSPDPAYARKRGRSSD